MVTSLGRSHTPQYNCKMSVHILSRDCPMFTSQNFVQLSLNVDDQCSANHGGLLCTDCRHNFTFTFQAMQCVPNDSIHCANWMPSAVLLLSVAFQFVLAFILVVTLRLKLGLGSGLLYVPYFTLLSSIASLLTTMNNYLCSKQSFQFLVLYFF